jgi:SAM-dependent methyltransferase
VNDEYPRVQPHGPNAAAIDGEVDVVVDVEEEDRGVTEPAPPLVPEGVHHVAAVAHTDGSNERSDAAVDSTRKPRPRMTLRIPDDEVSRPHSQPPPEMRTTISRAEVIAPSRIITINPPPSDDVVTSASPLGLVGMSAGGLIVPPALAKSAPRSYESIRAPDAPRAPDAHVAHDAHDTPETALEARDTPETAFDAPVAPDAPDAGLAVRDTPETGLAPPDTALDVLPVPSSDFPPEPLQSSDALELDEAESAAVLSSQRPPPRELPVAPRELPVAPRDEEPPPTARVPLATMPDLHADGPILDARTIGGDGGGDAFHGASGDVYIHVDEDEPVPSSGAEIAPEDLVSVESMPRDELEAPTYAAHAPPPPLGMQSTPELEDVEDLEDVQADQAAVGAAPPVAIAAPAIAAPAAPASAAAAPASAAASVADDPSARPPLVIVPPHGSPLAPPPMNESSAAAAARKRARPWWEELFGDDFIRTMAKITDAQIYAECDFIEDSLGVAKGAMVLDLGCGTGRHAIELTRRGYQVVGYDLSLPMLARAADEAQERDQKLNFLQGDMRDMTFEDTFDGIYSWNTSFGFFEEEKNAQVITRVHKALRMGGQFLLDVINRDFLIRQAPSLAWFEGDGCICMDEMGIDWITSRMRVKRTMMMDDGRSKEIEYSVRVYSLHELGKILHDHGFRVAEVSGRTATPGVFFGNESPRTLILAEKR